MTWSNLGQGSYPFSPFAMPSPNGIVEASVSTLSYSVLICFFFVERHLFMSMLPKH